VEEFTYNANDPEQVAWVQGRQRERELRLQALWKWVLDHPMGREFLMEVLFLETGPFNAVVNTPPEQTYGQVALHNLGRSWLTEYVWRFRDKYTQMVAEALTRADLDRKSREAKQLEWAQRKNREAMGNEGVQE
jgi:hypothetical protein